MSGARLAGALEGVDRIAEVVRGCAAESERLGHLAPAVIDALGGAGLFRILVPEDLGGGGLTIPESVAVFERVAALDASTAWALTILADGPIFARFLSEAAFGEICRDPDGHIAGSLNPSSARAERVEGGFRFSGTAGYLSGSAHARWVMATALVTEGGQLVADGGFPEIRSGFMPIGETRSLETWHVTGMRATGSNDHAFEDVFVADGWTFAPFDTHPVRDDPHASIPLWAQLGGGLAACAVGAAKGMLERFGEIAVAKVPVGGLSRLAERAPAQIALGEAHGLHHAAHAVLADTAADTWSRGVDRRPFDDAVLADLRLGTVTAVRLAAQAVDLLHDAAGMSAVASDSVLERIWRDVHTMTQHVILSPARYEIGGRVLLGLDARSPVI